MGAVAALPGGQELVALADKTKGDPAAIRGIAARWRKAAGGSAEPFETLGAAVTRVDAAWKGASADAFVTYMRRYVRAGDALHDALGACATSLDTAAGAVERARGDVVDVCDDLLAWVAEYRRRNPHASDEQLKPGISEQVGKAVSLAKGYVQSAETALSTASGEIGEHLKAATPTFASIPAAGDQSFVPGPGHTTQWIPVPAAEIDPVSRNGGTSSGGGFGGYGPSGPPPPGGGPAPKGEVAEWIRQAVEILKAHGYPVEKMNMNDIWMIIQHESGGNPHAINNWDSNAAAGHPSKGLMQTIDPTFSRWSLPGHKNIYDPIDNIIAGVRYAIERYGSVSNVPGVVGRKNGSGYVGY
ncbi:transglycosylase [Sphaerisporangium krabiense]|uniref:WXG100 family type VII secretion target n=1 Tax=Sphaerisporangium krabiense TaxID=763782 RepID=A0A7W8Z7G3_9ACTN|nr:transglycosylase SLT domain-containing protein [Sphaerisporangium krabiense]MBB5628781.1 WXG100 family type VII secretion target [Sphaerisporangium krabiense]GII60377.1 transglycosylase [Sphaerisporangium krabiense]